MSPGSGIAPVGIIGRDNVAGHRRWIWRKTSALNCEDCWGALPFSNESQIRPTCSAPSIAEATNSSWFDPRQTATFTVMGETSLDCAISAGVAASA